MAPAPSKVRGRALTYRRRAFSPAAVLRGYRRAPSIYMVGDPTGAISIGSFEDDSWRTERQKASHALPTSTVSGRRGRVPRSSTPYPALAVRPSDQSAPSWRSSKAIFSYQVTCSRFGLLGARDWGERRRRID